MVSSVACEVLLRPVICPRGAATKNYRPRNSGRSNPNIGSTVSIETLYNAMARFAEISSKF